MSAPEQLLRRLLEVMEEPDYNDRWEDGTVVGVYEYKPIPIKLLQEARAAVGLPLVDETVL